MTTLGGSRNKKKRVMGEPRKMTREEFEALERIERIKLIKRLIPIGLMAVSQELEREIESIISSSGDPSSPYAGARRYGSNPGSVVLGNQKVPIRVPRLRGQQGEISLDSYELLHREEDSESLYNSILGGVSCRDFEKTVTPEPGSISKSKSTISRKFTKQSMEQLKKLHERDLTPYDIVAVFLDGTPFAKDQMIIGLGVTLQGEKVILGFIQSGTENAKAVHQFLTSLKDRGLSDRKGLLVITDGSKGLIAGARKAFSGRCLIQRCQWHKRENVVSYMSKPDQNWLRKRLTDAWTRPTFDEASSQLKTILAELEKSNQSAASSLKEGLDETLTLHKLGVFPSMGRSFKTTNCLESINAMAEQRCGKIRNWKTSDQKQRWLASALNEVEPTLNRVAGSVHLLKLRNQMAKELKIEEGSVTDSMG